KMTVTGVEIPSFRMAGAEEAIRLCTERLQALIDDHDLDNHKLAKDIEEEYGKLARQIDSLTQATVFKGEKRRGQTVAEFAASLQSWARKRLGLLLGRYVASIYRRMLGNAPEYRREVNLCRQQLSEIAAQLQKSAEQSAAVGPSQDRPI